MDHSYIRYCYRKRDGKQFEEMLSISGEQVAMQLYGSRGDRLAFLELLNRWNRNGALNGEYFYCYVAN